MRNIMRVMTLIILTSMAAISMASGAFAGWEESRELSMRLKEKGRAVEAYRAAAAFRSENGNEMFDREFVCGWIALRNANRPDVALEHFKSSVGWISKMKKDKRGAAKAKAAYWLGRSLKQLGRNREAEVFFRSSMSYSTTFYGQLSASELKSPINKNAVSQANEDSFPTKSLYWHDARAKKELILAVMRAESTFNQTAVSPKGAKGIMQVMDGTARNVGKKAGVPIDVSMMRKNADYNIAVGSRVLGDLITQFGGNTMLAVAGYNAGPLKVEEWLGRFGDPRGGATDPIDWVENIPYRETREYVQKVMGNFITYLALHQK